MRGLVSLLVFSFISISSFAADIEPAFEALKQSAVNYEPDGAVCEQVAKLKALEIYPPSEFLTTTGVEYSTGGNTIGELDLLVIRRDTQKVVLVAEVKCWRNYGQALDKAKAQRDRFTWNLKKYPQQIRFEPYDEQLKINADQFDSQTVFRSISHWGGTRHGFDQELEFNLTEMKELRMKLLKCQAWGECARPQ